MSRPTPPAEDFGRILRAQRSNRRAVSGSSWRARALRAERLLRRQRADMARLGDALCDLEQRLEDLTRGAT